MAWRQVFVASAALAMLASSALAAPADVVVTHHRAMIAGRALDYDAEAGQVAIREAETGEPHGHMFYVYYSAAQPAGARPVTFVWNGGPGANSSLLHFGVAGPKRAEGDHLVDNADSWLTATDLVFVDPVGTGFSRPAKKEYADEFYNTVGDVESVTEFVRAWRLLHGAEARPLFLAGESWGSGRAGNVGYALEKRGVRVSGLILISGGTGIGAKEVSPELGFAMHVADLAATAQYHGRTPPDLGRDEDAIRRVAERWAREIYAPALAKPDALSDEARAELIDQLSKFTGLPADKIDRQSLRFTARQYLTGVLADQNKTLNIFDMRRTSDFHSGSAPAILRYLRHDLNYRTDLPYIGLERLDEAYLAGGSAPESVGARWVYATIKVTPEDMEKAKAEASQRGGGPPSIGPPLPSTAEASALDPKLRVLVATGLYDSLGSCARNAEIAAHLAEPLRSAVEFKCYVGGHQMYHDAASRVRFSDDVRRLIKSATEH